MLVSLASTELFNCGLCEQGFDHDTLDFSSMASHNFPYKLIPCGHVICQSCLYTISQNNSNILCPFCGKLVKVPKFDHSLIARIQKIKMRRSIYEKKTSGGQ